MNWATYILLFVSIGSGSAGQLLLKRGMSRRPGFQLAEIPGLVRDLNIWSGFLCYGVSLLLYFKVLETIPLSLAFPTISVGYAGVVILSSILFKEPVKSSRWVAVILICLGVALVGLGAW